MTGNANDDARRDAAGPTPSCGRFRAIPRLRRLGVVILLTYLGVCLLVTMFQSSLIYFPTSGYPVTPTDFGMEYEDLTLTTGDGVSLAAWYVPRRGARGTLLYCHGNAGNISDRLHSIQRLHRMGVNVLIFDYRGYGRSEGKPSENGTYEDAEAAWRYLVNKRGEQPRNIAVFGRSLGGAVAIELAKRLEQVGSVDKFAAVDGRQESRSDGNDAKENGATGVRSKSTPAALIVESSFTSLIDIGRLHYPLLPVRLLLSYTYSSVLKVPDITCPKLFLHGSSDMLIPVSNGRKLFDAAREPKEFIVTPGDHNGGGFEYSPEFTKRLDDFLRKRLGGGSG